MKFQTNIDPPTCPRLYTVSMIITDVRFEFESTWGRANGHNYDLTENSAGVIHHNNDGFTV